MTAGRHITAGLLHSPDLCLPAAAWTKPVQGRVCGWSQPGRRPLPPIPIRPRQPASRCLWLSTTSSSRPSPWPRNSTHDSSSAFLRCTLLSANVFTSRKNLHRLPRSPRPAHAQVWLTSWVESRAIGQRGLHPAEKAFLSGSASYTDVKKVVLCGSGD